MPRKKPIGLETEPRGRNGPGTKGGGGPGRDPERMRTLNPTGMSQAPDPGPHEWDGDPDCPQVLKDLLYVYRRPRRGAETQEQRFLRRLRATKPKEFLGMLREEERAFRAVLKGRAAAAPAAGVKVEERPEADAGAAAALGLIRRLLEARPWEHS